MKFGSPEYVKAMQEVLNGDPEHRRLAKGETDSYLLVLDPEPAKGVHERIIVGYSMVDGEVTEVWTGERKTTFVLSGPYGIWVDILAGKIGPVAAMTTRRLKIRGNILRLLAGSDSTLRMVELLRTIPTEFEGAYASVRLGVEERTG
ncbi:MAG: SCP2 sterol-binding domain-containing protein [Firmicutes bacterium]|nr:SCP2 sterol-binding domain-containing protein [Bacillota bacterium]